MKTLLTLLAKTAGAAAVVTALVAGVSVSRPPRLSPCFPPSIMRWEGNILRWAAAYHLDPNLVATVMALESGGDPQAVSPAGARGLFQVMPGHFAAGEDPLDPETNALRGLMYLRQAWEATGGDVYRTLVAYNGGLGVLALPESQWPAETRAYARAGLAMWKRARSNQCRSQ